MKNTILRQRLGQECQMSNVNIKCKIFGLIFFIFFTFLFKSHFVSYALAVYEEGDFFSQPQYVPNEIIVKYKTGQTPSDLENQILKRQARRESLLGRTQNFWDEVKWQFTGENTPEVKLQQLTALLKQVGAVEDQELFTANINSKPTPIELQGFFLYKTTGQQTVSQMINSFRRQPEVEFAEPNYIMTIQATPNDPYYPQMWNLAKMQMDEAWDQTKGSTQIIVAVLDTGADFNHEDLKDNLITGRNFVSGSDNAQDDHGHGTHVAGTIGAVTNNAKGIAGITWDVKIMPLKVLNSEGSGTTNWIVNAIKYATDNNAKVINMSLGGCASQPRTDGSCPHQNNQISQTYKAAIDYALNKQVTVVTAAGNANDDAQWYSPPNYNNTPGRVGDILVVAATGPSDEKASYSNYGAMVKLAAPGGNKPGGSDACVSQNDIASCILSTFPGNRYTPWVGTSMASPHVAGVAALLLAKNPGLTPAQVESYLKNNTDPVTSSVPIGTGRVNANKALGAVSGDTPSGPTNTPTPSITPGGATATPGQATATPSISATNTPIPADGCPAQCPAGAPARSAGNANCDGVIDEQDYLLWQNQWMVYQSGGFIAKDNRTADFYCQQHDISSQRIDMIDFEIWRASALGRGAIPTVSPDIQVTPTTEPTCQIPNICLPVQFCPIDKQISGSCARVGTVCCAFEDGVTASPTPTPDSAVTITPSQPQSCCLKNPDVQLPIDPCFGFDTEEACGLFNRSGNYPTPICLWVCD